ncbi:hypothetical protein JCM3770_006557 [Rhodotorula araucariae]
MAPKPPIVEPIQSSSVAQPSTVSGSSGAAVHPSPVVDEGPADGSIPPSQAGQSARPGTQDALRGQGNSAAPASSLSREDQAPVTTEQRKATGPEFGGQGGTGGERFTETGARGGDEPRPGKPNADRNSAANLVEAGTTMAGDAGADSGLEPAEVSEDETEGGMRAKMEPKPKL